jgi:hypothetical protein
LREFPQSSSLPALLPRALLGHTFCTVELFDEVAKAVAECSFVTSSLPVILSLEMHCNPRQLQRITSMLYEHLKGAVIKVRAHKPRLSASRCDLFSSRRFLRGQYSELVAMDQVASLSPVDLKGRVFVKGKVKGARRSTVGHCEEPRLSSCRPTRTAQQSSNAAALDWTHAFFQPQPSTNQYNLRSPTC